MNRVRILLLGGAGAMAGVAVHDLLDSGVERIGLADVNFGKVREASERLHDDRVDALETDANDTDGLTRIMKHWDVVINSTWYELNLKVMGSAMRAGTHYLDLGGLYHMTLKQLAMDRDAKDTGVTCILGLGSSPGITNLMATHGAGSLTRVSKVKIRVGGAAVQPVPGLFSPPYSFRTIIDEACMPAAVLRAGKIEMVPGLSVKEEFVLPDPVGKVEGYFALHSELATLPSTIGRGIQDMDFVVAFSPEFSRSVSLLIKLGLTRRVVVELPSGMVVPYDLLTKLVDDLPRPADQPMDYGVRRVEIWGETDGEASHLVYDCISGPHNKWQIGGRALGTGVPASLGAQWLAKGKVKERGVLPPELAIDSTEFLHELGTNGRGIMTHVDDGKSRSQL